MFAKCLKDHNFYNLDVDGVTFMKETNRNRNLFKLLLTVHHIQVATVRLSQEKYCNDVFKRFQMSDVNPVSTSMEPNTHLSTDDYPPLDKRDPETVRNYQ